LKIGIICPTAHLEDFASQSNFHLILPHLFKKHPRYLEYYKYRVKNGDFVVQDNSIFELEESLPGVVLLETAELYEFSEVVAPEVLRSGEGSRKVLEDFLQFRSKNGAHVPVMAVAQGSTMDEIISYVFYLNEISEVSTIGLPFDTEHLSDEYDSVRSLTLRRVLKRWNLVTTLQKRAILMKVRIKPIHLMGLSDGIELQYYKNYTYDKGNVYIRSNDSSSCFMHGSYLIRYSERGLPCEKIKEKLSFSLNLREWNGVRFASFHDMKNCIDHNINMLKSFANYDSNSKI